MVKRKRKEIGQHLSPSSILENEEISEPDVVLSFLGSAIESTYWMQCWSSLKVLDGVCKSVKMQGHGKDYTLMSVYNKGGSKIYRDGNLWKSVSRRYNRFRDKLMEIGIRVDEYASLKKKVGIVEKVLDELVLVLKELSRKKNGCGVNEMLKYVGVVEIYLQNATKRDIDSELKVRKLLRRSEFKDCLSSMYKGKDKGTKITPASMDEVEQKKKCKKIRKPRMQKKKPKNNPHTEEDSSIKDRPSVQEKLKPGSSKKGMSEEESRASAEMRQEDGKWQPMFSGSTKQFHLENNKHPVIVLEYFRDNETNELAMVQLR